MTWSSPVPTGTRSGSNFGPRNGILHAGDDYPPEKRGQQGVPIYAIGDGKVIGVGSGLLKGHSGDRNVLIQHAGGVLSYYGHLASNDVKVGQKVKAGQKIGVMGYRGNTVPSGPDGTHLHLGIIVNGKFVDPSVFLNGKGIKVGKTAPVKASSGGSQPKPKPSEKSKADPKVLAYQKRQNKYGKAGLLEDGINGSKTTAWKKWAKEAQEALSHFRPYVGKVVADGDYGPNFYTQVKNVQKRNGLYPDGMLGNVMAKWMRKNGSSLRNRP